MVLFECWKCSPTCCVVNPVTHIYKKMANCSSNVTYFESVCPSKRSSVIIIQNTSFWTPNCNWMHSGWLQRSSRTHWWPESAEVWYGIHLCWSSARMLWSVIRRAWISLRMLPMSCFQNSEDLVDSIVDMGCCIVHLTLHLGSVSITNMEDEATVSATCQIPSNKEIVKKWFAARALKYSSRWTKGVYTGQYQKHQLAHCRY